MSNKVVVNVISTHKQELAVRGYVNELNQVIGESEEVLLPPTPTTIPNTCIIFVKERTEKEKKEGKFIPCTFNEAGSEKIQIRFLRNCTTLDVEHQARMRYEPIDDADFLGIRLSEGENIFPKNTTDTTLLEYLKVSYYNGNNKNRYVKGIEDEGGDSEHPILYRILDEEEKLAKKLESNKVRIAKSELISEIGKNEDLSYVYAEIFGIDNGMGIGYVQEKLMDKVEENYENFISVISQVQNEIKAQIQIYINAKKLILDSKTLSDISENGEFKVDGLNAPKAEHKPSQASKLITKSKTLWDTWNYFKQKTELN